MTDQNWQAGAPSSAAGSCVHDPDTLWAALLSLYAEPGVTQSCLRLQDELGCDVLLVLLAVLLARAGQRVTDEHVAQLRPVSRAWQADVVGPLRALRRDWRVREQHAEAVYACGLDQGQAAPLTTLRRRLAQLELAAEREEWAQLLRVLQTAASPPPVACSTAPAGDVIEDCLAYNLRQVLGVVDVRHTPLLEALCRAPVPQESAVLKTDTL